MSGSLSDCSLVIYSSISVLDCFSLLTGVHKIVVIILLEILQTVYTVLWKAGKSIHAAPRQWDTVYIVYSALFKTKELYFTVRKET